MFRPGARKLIRADAWDDAGNLKSKGPRTHHAFERGPHCEALLHARADNARLILGLTGFAADAKRVGNPKHPRWSHAADAPSLLLMTLRDL